MGFRNTGCVFALKKMSIWPKMYQKKQYISSIDSKQKIILAVVAAAIPDTKVLAALCGISEFQNSEVPLSL